MRRLLLVDDELLVLHALQRALRRQLGSDDAHIEIYTEPLLALARCEEMRFDIVIADYQMPLMNGVEFLKEVMQRQPDAVRMMLSASIQFDTLQTAINEAEVFRYIAKPWQMEELREHIELALARRDQAIAERQLADEVRLQRAELTPQQVEARRLEELEPGITRVNWGPDGSVILDP
jgi:two-component system probable response regulator PhcQ